MMTWVRKVSKGSAQAFHRAVNATKKGAHQTAKTAHKAVEATKRVIRRYR